MILTIIILSPSSVSSESFLGESSSVDSRNWLAESILKVSVVLGKADQTIDMVSALHLLQEKSIEQNKQLYIVFVDLKVFNTVSRSGLYKVLRGLVTLYKASPTDLCIS